MRLQYNRATMPAINPDLIPFTAHGASLANLLAWSSWNEIRKAVFKSSGSACQICDDTEKLEVHEIWAFASPPDEKKFDACLGIMKLIALASVCHDCHAMWHIGFARISRREHLVRDRMMRINRWSAAEFAAWDRASSDRSARRSDRYWGLDLSLVRHAHLQIDEAKGWIQADSGMLYRPPYYRPGTPNPDRPETHTGIIGADYALGGTVYPGHDIKVAYEGLNPLEGDFDFVRSMGTGVASRSVPVAPDLPTLRDSSPPERPRRSWWWHLKNLYVEQF